MNTETVSHIIASIITFCIFASPFIVLGVFVYSIAFFHGRKFLAIKNSIADYIKDCNDLNQHIQSLRNAYVDIKKTDYGEANYSNAGSYNYKRSKLVNAQNAPNIYDCSRSVCDAARKQPFKYICKYFNVSTNEQDLAKFEEILNSFLSAEDGKIALKNKREDILSSISNDIPFIIRIFFSNRLQSELGFEPFVFNSYYYPVFSFRYTSSGGNSGIKYDVTMDIPMLERFITYLAESVKFKKSVAGQRRLMTPKLRLSIIERDGHICQICHNSTAIEPNLLLEVDHIIPLSKGGITSEDNLQTLCWKCNRSKGSKMST